jgi:DNA-cytosine methyltransferase
MALRDIGADFEHYKLVEFDKYAVASYNAIHSTDFETTDICDVHGADLGIVEKDKYCYILTYSFPCTDLSVAGLMKGMSKSDWEAGHSTHSGLLWEVERILKECKQEELPDVLLMENVPQVHAEANRANFDSWLNFLKSKGYWNFWKDLNAKDFGIPQNRDRCFCVSILSKDFVDFEFPEPVKLEKVMKDYLEEEVDEKYYINNGKAKKLIAELIESGVLPTDNRQQTTDNRLLGLSTCVSSPLEKSRSQIALRQGMTQESATYKQTEAVLLKKAGTEFERVTDVASCLMARDYKGLGNYIGNGVIEWKLD